MSAAGRRRRRKYARSFARRTATRTTTECPAPVRHEPADDGPRWSVPTASGYNGVTLQRLRTASKCTPHRHQSGTHPLDSRSRVLAALIVNAFKHPFTAEGIAEHTGLTPAELSAELRTLAHEGVIDPGSTAQRITLCTPLVLDAVNLTGVAHPRTWRADIANPGHEQSDAAIDAAMNGRTAPDEGADWSTHR